MERLFLHFKGFFVSFLPFLVLFPILSFFLSLILFPHSFLSRILFPSVHHSFLSPIPFPSVLHSFPSVLLYFLSLIPFPSLHHSFVHLSSSLFSSSLSLLSFCFISSFPVLSSFQETPKTGDIVYVLFFSPNIKTKLSFSLQRFFFRIVRYLSLTLIAVYSNCSHLVWDPPTECPPPTDCPTVPS